MSKIIVIGASAGGIEALIQLVAKLPALPAPIFVVLHRSPHSNPDVLSGILSRAGVLKAISPQQNEEFEPGHIYVAPPDRHLLIKSRQIYLAHGPKENGHRPSVDVLFRTAAREYSSLVIGVVLSGTLDDGTAGLLTIKQQGGIAIVQDPAEALYSGMPSNAIENVDVDYILPVADMAATLDRLVHQSSVEEEEIMSSSQKIETDMAELDPEAVQAEKRPGKPSGFSCPECGGVLWELSQGSLFRFRCRTGHAYSAESLLAEQSESVEVALWSALRALEEMATFRHRMAERAERIGNSQRAQDYREQAQTAKKRAELLRKALLNGLNLDQLDVIESD